MKRRDFGKAIAGGVIGAGVAEAVTPFSANAQRAPRKNTLMHVGGDYHYVAGGKGADITGKENLEFNLRHGAKHLTVQISKRTPEGAWDLDDMKRMKDNCDKYGVVLEAIRMDSEYIMLRKGAERDRRLETHRRKYPESFPDRRQSHYLSLDFDTHPEKRAYAWTRWFYV